MLRPLPALLLLASLCFRRVIAGCDVVRTRSRGEIISPNFPNFYLPNQVCDYSIETEAGTIIRLTFQSFAIEFDSYLCPSDYLQIHDGDSVNSTLIGKFCGSTSPPEVVSSQNRLFLRFRADSQNTGTGFFANYSTIWLSAPAVTNVTVTSLSRSIARVDWKGLGSSFTVSNYTVTVKQLFRRHSSAPGCPTLSQLHSAITVTVNGSTTKTDISLPTDVDFQVFVTSVTTAGLRGLPSETVTGHTLPTASEAVREFNLELTEGTDNATFSWRAPCDSGGVLSRFMIVLEADVENQYAKNYILNRTVTQPLEEIYSISTPVSKLTAECLYRVTVVPVGPQELYGANHTSSFQVPARIPAQLQDVTVTALSSSSVRVQWEPAAEDHGTIVHYTVKVQPITRPRSFAPPLEAPVVAVSRLTLQNDFTNLLPDTLYQATVSAATSVGEGPPSTPAMAQTPTVEEVPSEPQNVSATALSSSAVSVQWEPPAQKNGKLTYYIVTLKPLTSPNSTVTSVNPTIVTVTGTTLQTDIDHLLAGTEYQIVVTATTTFGQGPSSDPFVVVTLPEEEGKLLLALDILRNAYVKSRDLICSVDPKSKENERLCPLYSGN